MNNVVSANNALVFSRQGELANLLIQQETLNAKIDEIKAELKRWMEKNKLISIDNDEILVTYSQVTSRETFDSKRFKEENQELYDKYVRITPVKSTIRIKVR